jgi:hypothetical protein
MTGRGGVRHELFAHSWLFVATNIRMAIFIDLPRERFARQRGTFMKHHFLLLRWHYNESSITLSGYLFRLILQHSQKILNFAPRKCLHSGSSASGRPLTCCKIAKPLQVRRKQHQHVMYVHILNMNNCQTFIPQGKH